MPKKKEASKPAGSGAGKVAGSPENDAYLNELEAVLTVNHWVAGEKVTSADKDALVKLEGAPDADTHPHTFGWWSLARLYTPALRDAWPAPAGGQ